MKNIILFLCYLIISIGFISPSYTADLYFIDAHSQVDEDIEQDELIQKMDAAGIQKTILSSRRRRRAFDIADWAEVYPDKIIASARVKSKHYKNNTKKFYKKIKKQIKSDGFNAMSEVLLYHAQKGDKADEVIIYPDDERVEFLLDEAKKMLGHLLCILNLHHSMGNVVMIFTEKWFPLFLIILNIPLL